MLGAKDGGRHLKEILATTACSLVAVSAEAGIQLKSYQTHTHVVVSVDPDVTYSVEPVLSGGKVTAIKLILNNIKDDLESLTGSVDARTDKVMVTTIQTADGKKVTYQFLLTDKAKAAGVEFFDYRSKSPAEISLDYWTHPQAAKVEAQVTKKKLTKVAQRKLLPVAASIFGGCGQPLNFSTEGVANYKVYHRAFDYRAFFNLDSADADYKYPTAAATGAKELQHYRLALKLYKESKYALVLRTIEFFDAQYPKSVLHKELFFLKANTFVQLSKLLKADTYLDQALDMYRRIVLEESDSERGRASLAFLIQELMNKGAPVFALEYALMGADQKPESYKNPMTTTVYRLASAEALYTLGEFDRAERAYQRVMDTGNAISVEGAFRIGELLSARKFWERAAIYYEKAIRQSTMEAGRFPSAFFNLAEAYFRLERYEDAERAYKEFDKRFPSDEVSWAAHLRLAELEQLKIRTPDPKKHELIAGLYEGVVNRHPYSAGAIMAELRMSRCFKGLSGDDRTRGFFENFFATRDLKYLSNTLLDSNETEQWLDLSEAAFFLNNGDPRAALKRADEYRLKIGKVPLSDSFKKVFAQAAVDLVIKLAKSSNETCAITHSSAQDGMGACANDKELLAVVEHYGDIAIKPEPIAYALAIAKAKLGTGDMKGVAEELALVESRLGAGTADDKDWYHLLKARTRRLLGDKPDLVIGELTQMREDGPLAVERFDELVQSSLHKEDLNAALAYDNRLLAKGLAEKLPLEARMMAEVRRVDTLARLKKSAEAAKTSSRVLLQFGTQTQFPQILARVRELRAQALYDSGDYKNAVEALDEILTQAPNHPRHTEFEFKRGIGLAKLGRENEAFETFKKLVDPAIPNDVWKKSAQAELDQLQWENKVQNLIKDKDRRSSQ
ncbi:MAG: tetratricopeptide repeat protein [Deltaproteobacteria bacterium]|nr:tetratricopeptide repeat protein [Deltaproteobacteria bacterium]